MNEKYCGICGVAFYKPKNRSAKSWEDIAKFCSRKCLASSLRDHIPWNKGTKGLMPIPWNKGKESIAMKGNQHAYLGDKAKPDAGRKRAQNAFKEIRPCKICGALDERPRMMIRHHIDHNTLNNFPSNVEFLCRKCHINEHRQELHIARGII